MMTPSRLRVVLVGLAAGILAALVFATPAQAHASMVSSDPAADSLVPSAPAEVRVEFNESVSPVAADTTVIAPDGSTATTSPATVDGNALVYPLRDDLPTGTFLVSYRVVSADGHPVPGGFTFSIGRTSSPPQSAETGADADPLVTGLVSVDRYLGYAGLALALGAGLLLVAGEPGSRRGAQRLVATGLSIVAGTAMVGLYLQVPYTAGRSLFAITGDDVGAVLASRFGGAAMVRLLVVLALLPMLRPLVSRPPGRHRAIGLAAGAVVLCGTWPFSGHATTSPAPPLTVLSDTVHVAAMGMWLGGLVVLVRYLLRRDDTGTAARFLPVWSRWATWLVAGLAVSGAAQALIELGSLDALWGTGYGRLILAKVGLFALVLAVAGTARRAVAARTPDDPTGLVRRVRRRALVELTIAVVVLGVTTAMVQATPGWSQSQVTAVDDDRDYYTKELPAQDYTLQFDLEPARPGANTAHLYLYDPDGRPLEPVEWHAAFGGDGIAPVEFGLDALSPNHASGDVSIPGPGDWEFTFRIRTSDIDEETVYTVVTVK